MSDLVYFILSDDAIAGACCRSNITYFILPIEPRLRLRWQILFLSSFYELEGCLNCDVTVCLSFLHASAAKVESTLGTLYCNILIIIHIFWACKEYLTLIINNVIFCCCLCKFSPIWLLSWTPFCFGPVADTFLHFHPFRMHDP